MDDLDLAVTPQELDAWLRSTDVDDAGGQKQEQQATVGNASSSQSPTPQSSSAAPGENEISLDYITAALHAGHDGSSSANTNGVVQGRGHYHQECSVSPLGVNDAPSPAPAPLPILCCAATSLAATEAIGTDGLR